MSDHGHFSSYEGHKERRTGKIRGASSRMHRALDGWMLARVPASPAQGSYFCTMCDLEQLGIVDQNWLERNFPSFLLRTLVVSDNIPSRSRLLSIWSKGGLMNRFDIGRCHCL